MTELATLDREQSSEAMRPDQDNLFVVVCASGFDSIPRMRSALMFAGLAAAADMRTILYCIQDAVDVMVKGNIERYEPKGTGPSIAGRLQEALEQGVEIQCCTQTMANKGIRREDLVQGVTPAGAMSLISITVKAKGSLSF